MPNRVCNRWFSETAVQQRRRGPFPETEAAVPFSRRVSVPVRAEDDRHTHRFHPLRGCGDPEPGTLRNDPAAPESQIHGDFASLIPHLRIRTPGPVHVLRERILSVIPLRDAVGIGKRDAPDRKIRSAFRQTPQDAVQDPGPGDLPRMLTRQQIHPRKRAHPDFRSCWRGGTESGRSQ